MEFILRKWQLEDARDLAEAADNPKIAGNLRNVFPNPYRLEDAEWFINDCISKGDEAQSLAVAGFQPVLKFRAVGSDPGGFVYIPQYMLRGIF